jgi:hypothetical protein
MGVWTGAVAVVGWTVMVTVDFFVSVTGTTSVTLAVTVAYCEVINLSIGIFTSL